MRRRWVYGLLVVFALLGAPAVRTANGGLSSIEPQELREWLTYIASDQLQGRSTFSAGLGLAAAYITDHLRQWGLKPGGDQGTYLQTVRVLGVKTTSRSSVTVEVGGESRTFSDGQGVTFPRNAGAKQKIVLDRVEFTGYGLDLPGTSHLDYAGKDVKGAAVVWLGNEGPKDVDESKYRLALGGRARYATVQQFAAASLGPAPRATEVAAPAAGAPSGGGRGNQPPAADFTTAQRLDARISPAVSGSDAFFEFLFSRAPTNYDDLKQRVANREPLPAFRLDGVKLTFNVDADYQVVRTQLTENIVAIAEGSDPQLKSTYVAFGAHYDHVGYAEGEVVNGQRQAPPGRVTPGAADDRIWNGADDDGSGSVAVMAIARAFAGTRAKRSVLLVWHTGEERGLWGSRYFADYPLVPIDRIVAQLNIDMIGRNRDNKESEANTVYLVGSDRISSELHEINRAANDAMPKPLALNYELNDPADPDQIYFRSDHYSYAAKGIPIIFFTTGLHPDYHANTDEVSKIEFGKLTRVAQLAYETGRRVANLDHAPVRDNKGPRAGRATP